MKYVATFIGGPRDGVLRQVPDPPAAVIAIPVPNKDALTMLDSWDPEEGAFATDQLLDPVYSMGHYDRVGQSEDFLANITRITYVYREAS